MAVTTHLTVGILEAPPAPRSLGGMLRPIMVMTGTIHQRLSY